MTPDPLEGLTKDLSSVLIAIDFDGTMAPIVDDPSTSVPLQGIPELLEQLVAAGATVLVVSGRPVRYLADHLPQELDLVGLYGLEGISKGKRWEHDNAGVWREVIADVAASASSADTDGMRVELKGLSITLHYRGHPELAERVEQRARVLAARSGLLVRLARQAVELHPPIRTDKGTVVEQRLGDATSVIVLGDDVADLAAFDAADRLAAAGIRAVRVGVRSDESPSELVDRADVVVDGPDGVRDFLRSLLPTG